MRGYLARVGAARHHGKRRRCVANRSCLPETPHLGARSRVIGIRGKSRSRYRSRVSRSRGFRRVSLPSSRSARREVPNGPGPARGVGVAVIIRTRALRPQPVRQGTHGAVHHRRLRPFRLDPQAHQRQCRSRPRPPQADGLGGGTQDGNVLDGRPCRRRTLRVEEPGAPSKPAPKAPAGPGAPPKPVPKAAPKK